MWLGACRTFTGTSIDLTRYEECGRCRRDPLARPVGLEAVPIRPAAVAASSHAKGRGAAMWRSGRSVVPRNRASAYREGTLSGGRSTGEAD